MWDKFRKYDLPFSFRNSFFRSPSISNCISILNICDNTPVSSFAVITAKVNLERCDWLFCDSRLPVRFPQQIN